MSITDVPLVSAYHAALETVLQRQKSVKSEDDLHDNVDVFRKARNEHDSSDGGPAHDLAVENVVRNKFIDLVSSLDIHQPEFQHVWDLIDLANALSEHELSEPSLAFYLIEELLDSQTIDGCRYVFDYLESRREQMVRKNFKTKSLVILRCCNELLRRLSRAEETVFCGRVFIYLFQTFPLGDRSSVNLRGVFHTENATIFEEATAKSVDAIQPMDIDSESTPQIPSRAATPSSTLAQDVETKTGRSTPSIKPAKSDPTSEPAPDLDTLYSIFWSLQTLFSDPPKLFTPQSMQQFKDGIASTLSCFRYVTKHSAPTAEPLDIKRGLKRKRDETLAGPNSSLASKYNPKYLTSRDLFDLEIHDMAFRRHFLVQALIMLDFLLSLSPAAKLKTVGLTNRSVLYAYTLSEDDTKWARSTRQSIQDYLQQSGIGTEGSLYYRMVDTVLSRDKNWARWKAENCPPISRPPISPETYLAAQASLKELSRIPSMVNPPGSGDFHFLSLTEPLVLLKNPSQKHRVPSLQDYYNAIQGDVLDMEMAMDDTEKADLEEKKAGRLWRALRSAKGKQFVMCEQIKNGDNLQALIEEDSAAAAKVNGDGDGDENDQGDDDVGIDEDTSNNNNEGQDKQQQGVGEDGDDDNEDDTKVDNDTTAESVRLVATESVATDSALRENMADTSLDGAVGDAATANNETSPRAAAAVEQADDDMDEQDEDEGEA